MGKGSPGKKSGWTGWANPNKEPLGERRGRSGGSPYHSRSDYRGAKSFHGHGHSNRGGHDYGYSGYRRDWSSRSRGCNFYGFAATTSGRGGYWSRGFGSREAQYFREQIQSLVGAVETEEEKEARINVEKKQREERQARKEEKNNTKKVRKIAGDLRRKLDERKSDGLEVNILEGTDDEEEEKCEEPRHEALHDTYPTNEDFRSIGIGRLPETLEHLDDNPEGGDLQEGLVSAEASPHLDDNPEGGDLQKGLVSAEASPRLDDNPEGGDLQKGLVSAAGYVGDSVSGSLTSTMRDDSEPRSSKHGGPGGGEQLSSTPKRLKRKANTEGNQERDDRGKKRKIEEATQRIVQQLKPIVKNKDNSWLRRVIDSKTAKSVKSLLMSTLVKEHRSSLTLQLNSVRFRHTSDEMLPPPSSESVDFDSEDALFSFQEIDVNDLPESLVSQIEDMIKRERPDIQEDSNKADSEEDDEIQEVPVPPKPPAPLVNLGSDSEEEVEQPVVRQYEGHRDMPERRPENLYDLSRGNVANSFCRDVGDLRNNFGTRGNNGNSFRGNFGASRNNYNREIEARSSVEVMKQKFKLLDELDRKESLWQERMENLRREMLTINDTLIDIRRERSKVIGDALSYRRN